MAEPHHGEVLPGGAEASAILRGAGATLAILFGSRARGDARASSDWDVGVLGLTADREQVAHSLAEVLGAPVDVVELERASPLLCDRAMREGQVLLDADGSRFARFASLTLRRFEDTAKHRRAVDASLRAFSERRTR